MEIEIYSKQSCSNCATVKNMLKSKCYGYEEYLINTKEDIAALSERVIESGGNGRITSVPQIFVDGVYMGGADAFMPIFEGVPPSCGKHDVKE